MKKKYLKHYDGTITDNEGNIVFYSPERFVSDICKGDNCFLCGAGRSEKVFNDEHITSSLGAACPMG